MVVLSHDATLKFILQFVREMWCVKVGQIFITFWPDPGLNSPETDVKEVSIVNLLCNNMHNCKLKAYAAGTHAQMTHYAPPPRPHPRKAGA